MQTKIGKLFVVATPIGNLKDMTLRSIDILNSVDRIAVEDTRHAKPLLKQFSIEKPTISLHDFNERERSKLLINYILAGESIALISDAGTPLISDPGFNLVREAKAESIEVIPIPGACAAIAALSVAGLPSNKFVFEGFLPAKKEACREHLNSLLHEARSIIFYEAPHRLLSVLKLMLEILGNRKVTIARELTKMHESILLNNLEKHIEHFETHPDELRGEIVLIVEGVDEAKQEKKEVIPEVVLDSLLKELPLKQAVSLASDITGVRKNLLYEMALAKKTEKPD